MVQAQFPDINVPGEGQLYVRFVTTQGNMVARLEEERAPKTVKNFVGLGTGSQAWQDARTGETHQGRPFYDGIIFHRVIPDFMVQVGCPLGRGTGGPGYRFGDEFHPQLRHNVAGILSMANAGPGTNGSQIFITEGPTPHLDNRHSVFGQVIAGVDLIGRIARVPTGPGDKPKTDVSIQKLEFFRSAAVPTA